MINRDDYSKEVGHVLFWIRDEQLRITQDEMANMAGLSLKTIQQMELGKTHNFLNIMSYFTQLVPIDSDGSHGWREWWGSLTADQRKRLLEPLLYLIHRAAFEYNYERGTADVLNMSADRIGHYIKGVGERGEV